MLSAIIVVIQLVRRNEHAINLENFLDITVRLEEVPQSRYVLRGNVLLYGV